MYQYRSTPLTFLLFFVALHSHLLVAAALGEKQIAFIFKDKRTPLETKQLTNYLVSTPKFVDLKQSDRDANLKKAAAFIVNLEKESFTYCLESGRFAFQISDSPLGLAQVDLIKHWRNTNANSHKVETFPLRPIVVHTNNKLILLEWPLTIQERNTEKKARRFVAIHGVNKGTEWHVTLKKLYLVPKGDGFQLLEELDERFSTAPLGRCLPTTTTRTTQSPRITQSKKKVVIKDANAEYLSRLEELIQNGKRETLKERRAVNLVLTSLKADQQKLETLRKDYEGVVKLQERLTTLKESQEANGKELLELLTKKVDIHQDAYQRARSLATKSLDQYNQLLRLKYLIEGCQSDLRIYLSKSSYPVSSKINERIQKAKKNGISVELATATYKAIHQTETHISASIKKVNDDFYIFSSRQKDLDAIEAEKKRLVKPIVEELGKVVKGRFEKTLKLLDLSRKEAFTLRNELYEPYKKVMQLREKKRQELEKNSKDFENSRSKLMRTEKEFVEILAKTRLSISSKTRKLKEARYTLQRKLVYDNGAFLSVESVHPWEQWALSKLMLGKPTSVVAVNVFDGKEPERLKERYLAVFSHDKKHGKTFVLLPVSAGADASRLFEKNTAVLSGGTGLPLSVTFEHIKELHQSHQKSILESKKIKELKSAKSILAFLGKHGRRFNLKGLEDIPVNYIPGKGDISELENVIAYVSTNGREEFINFSGARSAFPRKWLEKVYDSIYGQENIVALYPINNIEASAPDVFLHELVHILDKRTFNFVDPMKKAKAKVKAEKEFDRLSAKLFESIKATELYKQSRIKLLGQLSEDEYTLSPLSDAEKKKRIEKFVEGKILNKEFKEELKSKYVYMNTPSEKLAFAYQVAYLKEEKKMSLDEVIAHLSKLGFSHTSGVESAVFLPYWKELYERGPAIIEAQLLSSP